MPAVSIQTEHVHLQFLAESFAEDRVIDALAATCCSRWSASLGIRLAPVREGGVDVTFAAGDHAEGQPRFGYPHGRRRVASKSVEARMLPWRGYERADVHRALGRSPSSRSRTWQGQRRNGCPDCPGRAAQLGRRDLVEHDFSLPAVTEPGPRFGRLEASPYAAPAGGFDPSPRGVDGAPVIAGLYARSRLASHAPSR